MITIHLALLLLVSLLLTFSLADTIYYWDGTKLSISGDADTITVENADNSVITITASGITRADLNPPLPVCISATSSTITITADCAITLQLANAGVPYTLSNNFQGYNTVTALILDTNNLNAPLNLPSITITSSLTISGSAGVTLNTVSASQISLTAPNCTFQGDITATPLTQSCPIVNLFPGISLTVPSSLISPSGPTINIAGGEYFGTFFPPSSSNIWWFGSPVANRTTYIPTCNLADTFLYPNLNWSTGTMDSIVSQNLNVTNLSLSGQPVPSDSWKSGIYTFFTSSSYAGTFSSLSISGFYSITPTYGPDSIYFPANLIYVTYDDVTNFLTIQSGVENVPVSMSVVSNAWKLTAPIGNFFVWPMSGCRPPLVGYFGYMLQMYDVNNPPVDRRRDAPVMPTKITYLEYVNNSLTISSGSYAPLVTNKFVVNTTSPLILNSGPINFTDTDIEFNPSSFTLNQPLTLQSNNTPSTLEIYAEVEVTIAESIQTDNLYLEALRDGITLVGSFINLAGNFSTNSKLFIASFATIKARQIITTNPLSYAGSITLNATDYLEVNPSGLQTPIPDFLTLISGTINLKMDPPANVLTLRSSFCILHANLLNNNLNGPCDKVQVYATAGNLEQNTKILNPSGGIVYLEAGGSYSANGNLENQVISIQDYANPYTFGQSIELATYLSTSTTWLCKVYNSSIDQLVVPNNFRLENANLTFVSESSFTPSIRSFNLLSTTGTFVGQFSTSSFNITNIPYNLTYTSNQVNLDQIIYVSVTYNPVDNILNIDPPENTTITLSSDDSIWYFTAPLGYEFQWTTVDVPILATINGNILETMSANTPTRKRLPLQPYSSIVYTDQGNSSLVISQGNYAADVTTSLVISSVSSTASYANSFTMSNNLEITGNDIQIQTNITVSGTFKITSLNSCIISGKISSSDVTLIGYFTFASCNPLQVSNALDMGNAITTSTTDFQIEAGGTILISSINTTKAMTILSNTSIEFSGQDYYLSSLYPTSPSVLFNQNNFHLSNFSTNSNITAQGTKVFIEGSQVQLPFMQCTNDCCELTISSSIITLNPSDLTTRDLANLTLIALDNININTAISSTSLFMSSSICTLNGDISTVSTILGSCNTIQITQASPRMDKNSLLFKPSGSTVYISNGSYTGIPNFTNQTIILGSRLVQATFGATVQLLGSLDSSTMWNLNIYTDTNTTDEIIGSTGYSLGNATINPITIGGNNVKGPWTIFSSPSFTGTFSNEKVVLSYGSFSVNYTATTVQLNYIKPPTVNLNYNNATGEVIMYCNVSTTLSLIPNYQTYYQFSVNNGAEFSCNDGLSTRFGTDCTFPQTISFASDLRVSPFNKFTIVASSECLVSIGSGNYPSNIMKEFIVNSSKPITSSQFWFTTFPNSFKLTASNVTIVFGYKTIGIGNSLQVVSQGFIDVSAMFGGFESGSSLSLEAPLGITLNDGVFMTSNQSLTIMSPLKANGHSIIRGATISIPLIDCSSTCSSEILGGTIVLETSSLSTISNLTIVATDVTIPSIQADLLSVTSTKCTLNGDLSSVTTLTGKCSSIIQIKGSAVNMNKNTLLFNPTGSQVWIESGNYSGTADFSNQNVLFGSSSSPNGLPQHVILNSGLSGSTNLTIGLYTCDNVSDVLIGSMGFNLNGATISFRMIGSEGAPLGPFTFFTSNSFTGRFSNSQVTLGYLGSGYLTYGIGSVVMSLNETSSSTSVSTTSSLLSSLSTSTSISSGSVSSMSSSSMISSSMSSVQSTTQASSTSSSKSTVAPTITSSSVSSSFVPSTSSKSSTSQTTAQVSSKSTQITSQIQSSTSFTQTKSSTQTSSSSTEQKITGTPGSNGLFLINIPSSIISAATQPPATMLSTVTIFTKIPTATTFTSGGSTLTFTTTVVIPTAIVTSVVNPGLSSTSLQTLSLPITVTSSGPVASPIAFINNVEASTPFIGISIWKVQVFQSSTTYSWTLVDNGITTTMGNSVSWYVLLSASSNGMSATESIRFTPNIGPLKSLFMLKSGENGASFYCIVTTRLYRESGSLKRAFTGSLEYVDTTLLTPFNATIRGGTSSSTTLKSTVKTTKTSIKTSSKSLFKTSTTTTRKATTTTTTTLPTNWIIAETCAPGKHYNNPKNCCCAPNHTKYRTMTKTLKGKRGLSTIISSVTKDAVETGFVDLAHLCQQCPTRSSGKKVVCCKKKSTVTKTIFKTRWV